MELRLRRRLVAGTLTLLLLLLLLILASSPTAASPAHQIRILSAEKRVDLTSSIVRVFLTLKLENTSPDAPASSFLLVFSPAESARLSLLKAAVPSGKRKKKTYSPLTITPAHATDAPDGTQSFTVAFNAPVPAAGTAVVEVLYVLTHALEPFPAEIGQSEPQLVYYRDSATLLSPYRVVEQVMYVKVGNGRVESFTRVEPTGRSGGELKYGGYSSTEAYKVTPVMVHFENNSPFAVVEELVREVEVSHWGSVQVTEHFRLKHGGARHTGVFSRLEYQSRPAVSGASSFKHLLARLPPHVHSVYYRDEIGNISSSHLRNDALKSELEIEPRYPLFGGWKATFVIGYGLPLQDFLFESPDGKRYLNFSFGCPLLETVVDELTIKVVLPEGSKNPSAEVPFSVEQHLETSYSYLDIAGRTTVVLKKKNVVPEHNIPFQIYYDFNPIFMLSEPLMLISVFLLFFVGCVAYLHIDLSIAKS